MHVEFSFQLEAEAHGNPLPSGPQSLGPGGVLPPTIPHVTYPIKLSAYCEFSMYEHGRTLLKVEGEPEVIATVMAAWWTEHGADHIRDRLEGR